MAPSQRTSAQPRDPGRAGAGCHHGIGFLADDVDGMIVGKSPDAARHEMDRGVDQQGVGQRGREQAAHDIVSPLRLGRSDALGILKLEGRHGKGQGQEEQEYKEEELSH